MVWFSPQYGDGFLRHLCKKYALLYYQCCVLILLRRAFVVIFKSFKARCFCSMLPFLKPCVDNAKRKYCSSPWCCCWWFPRAESSSLDVLEIAVWIGRLFLIIIFSYSRVRTFFRRRWGRWDTIIGSWDASLLVLHCFWISFFLDFNFSAVFVTCSLKDDDLSAVTLRYIGVLFWVSRTFLYCMLISFLASLLFTSKLLTAILNALGSSSRS